MHVVNSLLKDKKCIWSCPKHVMNDTLYFTICWILQHIFFCMLCVRVFVAMSDPVCEGVVPRAGELLLRNREERRILCAVLRRTWDLGLLWWNDTKQRLLLSQAEPHPSVPRNTQNLQQLIFAEISSMPGSVAAHMAIVVHFCNCALCWNKSEMNEEWRGNSCRRTSLGCRQMTEMMHTLTKVPLQQLNHPST